MSVAISPGDTQEKPEGSEDSESQKDDFEKIIDANYGYDERKRLKKVEDGQTTDEPDGAEADELEDLYSAGAGSSESAAATSAGSEDRVGRGYTKGDGRKERLTITGGLRAVGKSKKAKYSSAIILAIITGIAVFGQFFSTLKLTNFLSHIERNRMTRVERRLQKNLSRIYADKVALQSATPEEQSKIKAKYSGMRSATWGKFDQFRPKLVLDNFKGSSALSFVHENPSDLTSRITHVVINNEKIPIQKYQGFGRVFANYQERIRFAAQINTNLDYALRGNGGGGGMIHSYVRSQVSKAFLAEHGIKLYWWEKLGETYRNTSAAEADKLAEADTAERVTTQPREVGAGTVEEGARTAGDDVAKAVQTCIKDQTCYDELKLGKIPTKIASVITDYAARVNKANALFSLVGLGFVVPLCQIYDGSVIKSQSNVDAQNQEATRSFFAVASAASQQQKGDSTSEAIGAMNDKLGRISDSIPEKMFRGESTSTTGIVPPQATRIATYSIFSVLFGQVPAGVIQYILDKLCPIADDPVAAGGIAALLTAVSFIPAAGQAIKASLLGEEATLNTLSRVATEVLMAKLQSTFLTKAGLKGVGMFVGKMVAQQGAITGITYMAKMLAMSEGGAFINTLSDATGIDFANEADMGGMLFANEMMRQGLFGAPLTSSATQANAAADQQFIAAKVKNESIFERVLSINNPDSFTNTALMYTMDAPGQAGSFRDFIVGFPTKIFSTFTHVLNPFAKASAAGTDFTSLDTNYDSVQWGWTDEEENLIDTDESFSMLDNAKILSDSGQMDAIAAKYGLCFKDTTGNLFSSGNITRDDNGAINGGLCSPANLGIHNSEFGPMMVFRWRLDQSYQNSLDELDGIQTGSDSTTTTGAPTTPASGTTTGSTGTGATTTVDTSSYQNPFRDVPNISSEGVDQGVDYKGDGPVHPIGNAVITYYNTKSGWEANLGGYPAISYQLTDGPAKGLTIYVAENCTLNPSLHVASQVTANDTLCDMHSVFPYIETGWAQTGTDQAVGPDPHSPNAVGINFSNLMRSLGAPEGSSATSGGVGTVPAGYPSW